MHFEALFDFVILILYVGLIVVQLVNNSKISPNNKKRFYVGHCISLQPEQGCRFRKKLVKGRNQLVCHNVSMMSQLCGRWFGD